MDNEEKTRENWARRKLSRMGYALEKSRRKDPDAYDFGLYRITQDNKVIWGTSGGMDYELSLDDVYAWIKEQTAGRVEK